MGQCYSAFPKRPGRDSNSVLHPELLSLTFQFLDPKSLANCELVCRQWHLLILRGHGTYQMQRLKLDCLCILENQGSRSPICFYPHRQTSHGSTIMTSFSTRHLPSSLRILRRVRIRSLCFWRLSSGVGVRDILFALASADCRVQEIHFYRCDFFQVGEFIFRAFLDQFKFSLRTLVVDSCPRSGEVCTDNTLAVLLEAPLNHLSIFDESESLQALDELLPLLLAKKELAYIKVGNCRKLTDSVVSCCLASWANETNKQDKHLDLFSCGVNLYHIAQKFQDIPVAIAKKTLFLEMSNKKWSCFAII